MAGSAAAADTMTAKSKRMNIPGVAPGAGYTGVVADAKANVDADAGEKMDTAKSGEAFGGTAGTLFKSGKTSAQTYSQFNATATNQAESDLANQTGQTIAGVQSGAGRSKGFASNILTSGLGLLDEGNNSSVKKNRLLGF